MASYFVLVDKRDREKFRQFQIGQSGMPDGSHKFVWGFHQSQALDSWQKIKKNNRVLFTIPRENFRISSKVAKKIIDHDLGEMLWPDSLNSRQVTHFLLFDEIQRIDLSFINTVDSAVNKIEMTFPGLYELGQDFKVNTDELGQKQHLSKPKQVDLPTEKKGSAQKDMFEVMRFMRDSTKVKKLKTLYKNKCQICDYTFEYKKNHFYSEVHHYNPLKANADDDMGNMIVVCPNHHAEFDYNMIAISDDGTSIVNRAGKKTATIRFKNGHKLDAKNIESQLVRN